MFLKTCSEKSKSLKNGKLSGAKGEKKRGPQKTPNEARMLLKTKGEGNTVSGLSEYVYETKGVKGL
jgi:hypothetical protein